MDHIDFRIGQLTKELVAQRLKSMEDPCAVAAELVRQTLDVALKSKRADAAKIASDTCYGAMQGLMLANQEFTRATVMILQAVNDNATVLGLDPTAQMMAALRGYARLAKLCTIDQIQDMKTRIEANFNGAGEAFSTLLAEEQAEFGKDPSGKAASP
jgi:hypothetical protein